jgi:hypothetical protein
MGINIYTSHVLNDEWDKKGIANTISLYATFPIPQRDQSSFSLYASAKRINVNAANPEADSGELNQIIAKHDPDTFVDLQNNKHVIDSTIEGNGKEAVVWFMEHVCVQLKKNSAHAVIKEINGSQAVVEFDDKSTQTVRHGDVQW